MCKNPIASAISNEFLHICERIEQESSRKRVTFVVELDQYRFLLNTWKEPLMEVRDAL